MLRSLSDGEYMDVLTVCAQLPHVEMSVRTEGKRTATVAEQCMIKYRELNEILKNKTKNYKEMTTTKNRIIGCSKIWFGQEFLPTFD